MNEEKMMMIFISKKIQQKYIIYRQKSLCLAKIRMPQEELQRV